MKHLHIGMIFVLAGACATILGQEANTQSATPVRFSQLSFTPYNPARGGYETLPVQVVGVGGGKLSANERFRIFASRLKNTTGKSVQAVRFGYFIFASSDLGEVLEKAETAVIQVDLPALQTRNFQIQVIYTDEIPLLKNKPGEEYRLEIAVTEVHYDDGSIWRGTDLPQKLIPVSAR